MKAFVVEKVDNKFISQIKEIDTPVCENENEVVIKVSYSSLNYKDALSSVGNPGVTKVFPHVTGIDVAGVVSQSTSNIFKKGERVIVTGYDMGMNSDGGHAQYVKVPSHWIARIPDSITDKEIMTYGTAGLTAALSVSELIKNNVVVEDGKILVTGATGGVGSIAVSILSKIGYKVVAITGKEEQFDYLKKIGATEIILRDEFNNSVNRPLLSEKYAGVVDTVGGDILATALKQVNYDGVVTCCGLTSSHELNTNVFPFILRGVRLIGIDSVECKLEKKQKAWEHLANKWKIDNLKEITTIISMSEIKGIYDRMLRGKTVGRYVVKVGEN